MAGGPRSAHRLGCAAGWLQENGGARLTHNLEQDPYQAKTDACGHGAYSEESCTGMRCLLF